MLHFFMKNLYDLFLPGRIYWGKCDWPTPKSQLLAGCQCANHRGYFLVFTGLWELKAPNVTTGPVVIYWAFITGSLYKDTVFTPWFMSGHTLCVFQWWENITSYNRGFEALPFPPYLCLLRDNVWYGKLVVTELNLLAHTVGLCSKATLCDPCVWGPDLSPSHGCVYLLLSMF